MSTLCRFLTGHFSPTICLNDGEWDWEETTCWGFEPIHPAISLMLKSAWMMNVCQQLANLPQSAQVMSILPTSCQSPTICLNDERSTNSLPISHNLPKACCEKSLVSIWSDQNCQTVPGIWSMWHSCDHEQCFSLLVLRSDKSDIYK